jgi:E1A/CREB-binding protein
LRVFEQQRGLLNFCNGNHYQFNQLRRAMHTSIMVLRRLHKFVQQCVSCSRVSSFCHRIDCQTCPDFGQCQESQLTEAQRQEQQRHMQLHIQFLQCAATCNSPKCPSDNCIQMEVQLRQRREQVLNLLRKIILIISFK